MLKVNIHEAKANLSRYAKRVQAGETVLLCERNQPSAEIRPLKNSNLKVTGSRPRRLGQDAGKGLLPDDWDSPQTNAMVAALFGVGE